MYSTSSVNYINHVVNYICNAFFFQWMPLWLCFIMYRMLDDSNKSKYSKKFAFLYTFLWKGSSDLFLAKNIHRIDKNQKYNWWEFIFLGIRGRVKMFYDQFYVFRSILSCWYGSFSYLLIRFFFYEGSKKLKKLPLNVCSFLSYNFFKFYFLTTFINSSHSFH